MLIKALISLCLLVAFSAEEANEFPEALEIEEPDDEIENLISNSEKTDDEILNAVKSFKTEARRLNKYEQRIKAALEFISRNETLFKLYKQHVREHQRMEETFLNETKQRRSTFPCADSYHGNFLPPTSVHSLRPEHISVVAALGDSLTAGNGILGQFIWDCLTEYRGRAWSIGGDLDLARGVETLPNFIRKFNSGIKGASVGKCDESNTGCSQLNVAVAGAEAPDLPGQADDLINRMRSRSDIDMNNDWKVITMFIGGNDLCSHCQDRTKYSAANYRLNIQTALDKLKANIPKAFVNLVQIFDIAPLAEVSTKGLVCNLVTTFVCDCKSSSTSLTQMSLEYQRQLENLVNSGRYDADDDFTVVLQPFFQHTEPARNTDGSYDMSFFAPDCFHFSARGTYAAAKSLWNNMIEPVGCKQSTWHLFDPFHCPHTHGVRDGVFRTKKNSPTTFSCN